MTAVAFSSDGHYVLTGSEDDTAVLRAVDTGKTVRQWRQKRDVTAVEFSPDARYVLTGSDDVTTVLRDTRTGDDVPRQPLRLLPTGATVVGRVSKPAEGQRLSTAHRIKRVRNW